MHLLANRKRSGLQLLPVGLQLSGDGLVVVQQPQQTAVVGLEGEEGGIVVGGGREAGGGGVQHGSGGVGEGLRGGPAAAAGEFAVEGGGEVEEAGQVVGVVGCFGRGGCCPGVGDAGVGVGRGEGGFGFCEGSGSVRQVVGFKRSYFLLFEGQLGEQLVDLLLSYIPSLLKRLLDLGYLNPATLFNLGRFFLALSKFSFLFLNQLFQLLHTTIQRLHQPLQLRTLLFQLVRLLHEKLRLFLSRPLPHGPTLQPLRHLLNGPAEGGVVVVQVDVVAGEGQLYLFPVERVAPTNAHALQRLRGAAHVLLRGVGPFQQLQLLDGGLLQVALLLDVRTAHVALGGQRPCVARLPAALPAPLLSSGEVRLPSALLAQLLLHGILALDQSVRAWDVHFEYKSEVVGVHQANIQIQIMKQEQGVAPLRSISLTDKRDLMWNIIEPGDPYDIRKSMIAKLPGTRKFMGPHLEIVCLLQAAEIERLCAYLEEYQMKFRENERIELDRHSYEIQIRELSERLGEEENMRSDIEKLREFIRKQSKELEDLQRQQYNSELARRYEESLRQIETLTAERSNATTQLQVAQSQLQLLQAAQQDSQRESVVRLQTERTLNEQILLLEGERSRYASELAFLNANLSEKGRQIEQLEEGVRSLKLQAEKGRAEEAKRVQLAHTLQEYENRFQIMAQEIDRLNSILREKAKEMNEQYNRYKLLLEEKTHKDEVLVEYEFKIRSLEENITTLEREHRQSLVSLSTLEESKALIQSYENSLEKFSVEVDRLNTVLRKKLHELEEAKRRNSEYEFRLKGHEATERENNDYRTKYAEITKQMGDYEKKLNAQTQELERLNFSIKRLIEELNYSEVKLKNAEKEIEGQQKRVAAAEAQAEREREGRSVATERAGAMARENEELKSRLRRSEAEHVQLMNSQVSKYAQEISQLNQSLLKQSEELQYLRSSIDLSHKPSIHEENQYVESLRQQIQQQNSRIAVLEGENSRLVQSKPYVEKSTMEEGSPVRSSENARIMAAQYEEIARISQLLKQRETEVRSLNAELQRRDELPNMEMTHSEYLKIGGGDNVGKESARSNPSELINIEQQRKMADLEQSSFLLKTELVKHGEQQSRLIQERTNMSRELEECKSVIGEYELRITQLMAEIQRQNGLLTDKNSQLSSFEGLAGEFERLKNLNGELADQYEIILSENVSIRRQLQIDDQEKKHLQTELEDKIRELIRENYHLQEQSEGKEQTAALLGSLNSLKHDISILQEQNKAIELERSQFANENRMLKTEINAIWTESNILRSSTNQLQTDNNNLAAQNANLKADNTALSSANAALTAQINQLNIEIVSLRKRVQEQSDYYGKVVLYDQEIERLNRQLQTKDQEIKTITTGQQDYTLKLRAAEDSLTRATQEHQLRISSYEQKSARLTSDLNSLQQVLSSKQAELDLLQRKLLENKQQSAKLIEQVENLQSKIRLFAPEIERLNFNLKNKLEEGDRLQQQNRYLTSENEDLKSRLRETPDLRSTLTTYQSKIALFSQEIERLNITLRTKIDTFNALEAEYSRYRSESELKLLSYTRAIEDGNAKINGLTAELESHRAQAVQVETLSEYESKLYELSSEIERLNRLLFSTTKQLQELQQRDSNYLSEIERLNNSLRLKVDECVRWEQIEHELKNSVFNQEKQVLQRQEELEILTTKYTSLGKESKTQKEHLAEYELRIKQMYEEFERLQDIIKVLRKEREEQTTTQNSELAARNRNLAEEIERLRALIAQQKQQISEIRLLLVDQSSLQQSNQQQLTIIVALLAETDSLRSRLQTETSSLQQRHISEIDSYFL